MQRESQRQRLERCLEEVEKNPDMASAFYNLGLAYGSSARVKDAEAAYKRALELEPSMVQAWVNLGGICLLRWDFEGCLKANQEAARLDEDLLVAHFNMGQAYLYLNQPEKLVECNKRVLELDPTHAEAHYFAAVGHLALDNHGAAQRHLGRAMELGHKPPPDFVKAMEQAQMKRSRQQGTLVEITGAPTPEKPKED